MSDSTTGPQVIPPPLPIPPDDSRRAVTCERLRLLSIAFRISGILGAGFVSILLIHFFVFTAISFIPESAFQSTGSTQHSPHQDSQPNIQKSANAGPPVIIFRVIAGVIGVIILCGWILGGLTFYAGHCIAKRQKRTFVLVMAGINFIWLPYGLLLGMATFLALETDDAKLEYRV